MLELSSDQNPRIKQLQKLLQKSRERHKTGLFVVEGLQENTLALKGSYEAEAFFICEEICPDPEKYTAPNVYKISLPLFEKLSYRESTGGLLGLYKKKTFSLQALKMKEVLSLLVLEGVEKPGNLGAMLRTADAAAIDAVVVVDPKVDFFSPNVIRASVGTVFTNKLIATHAEDLMTFLKEHQVKLYATHLHATSQSLFEVSFAKRSAILLGTEAVGISDAWLDLADTIVKIPMLGTVDSLNVSNAAAVCLYERLRQLKI